MARRAKNTAGNGGDGRQLGPDDNMKAAHEAERAQLLSFMARLSQQSKKVDEAKGPYDAARDELTEIFRLAKAAGFNRKDLEAHLADMRARGRNLVEEEVRRRRHREWLGLPTGAEQLSLFTSEETPQAVKDEAFWRSEGYQRYWRGEDRGVTEECPPMFHQAMLKGWDDAQSSVAWSMAAVATQAASTAEDEPESGKDGEGDGEAEGDEPTGAEGFEASEEELGKQNIRKAIRGRREDAEENEPV